MIAIDQYGQFHEIEGKYPRKELMDLFGVKSAQKIYGDNKEGNADHRGYVISGLWLILYKLEPVVLK